jgi:drug/metabolite transporter (DMT)-like permease
VTASLSEWLRDLPGPARAGLWMTISAMCYAVSGTIIRHLAGDLPTFEIVFVRNLFGLVFMMPWLARVGAGALRTHRIGMHTLRGFSSAVNVSFQVAALAYIPVADMAAITFLQPILGSLIAVAALGEVLNGRRWGAMAMGFAGALLIIRPGFEAVNIGVILALGSAVAGAIISIMIKDLVRTEAPETIAAYLFLIQALIMLVPALLVWTALSWQQFFWLGVLGLFGVILQVTFNRSMRAADASVALPFNFTRLIWAALLGWLVFAELPDIWVWIGGAVIFSASIFLARRGS